MSVSPKSIILGSNGIQEAISGYGQAEDALDDFVIVIVAQDKTSALEDLLKSNHSPVHKALQEDRLIIVTNEYIGGEETQRLVTFLTKHGLRPEKQISFCHVPNLLTVLRDRHNVRFFV